MARPLNTGVYPYIVFYKSIGSKNPVKAEMTIRNTHFNVVYARNGNEAMLIGREAIYHNLLLPYHSRRFYFEKFEISIEELKKMKTYVSCETWAKSYAQTLEESKRNINNRYGINKKGSQA